MSIALMHLFHVYDNNIKYLLFIYFPYKDFKFVRDKTKLNSMVWVRERTIPTERPPLVGEVIANFCGWGYHVVSVTDPYGRILGFIDRSRYFYIK
jgi:hypothetical protein